MALGIYVVMVTPIMVMPILLLEPPWHVVMVTPISIIRAIMALVFMLLW